MKAFIRFLVSLMAVCGVARAVTVNFASPPFSADFLVNQPGNSIAIKFPGVTNVAYIPGTFGYISNQIVYLGTNNFAGGGGGGSGITALTGDGTASGSGSVTFTLATVLASPGTYRSVTVNGKGLATAGSNPTTFAGYGISDTWVNLAADLTGLVPTASLGTGTANGTTFLRGDGSWVGTLTNVVYTNSGPDTLVRGDICFLNTNTFGGGGGGGGITALTGDVTASGSGSVAATVKGINGTLLSSLQSGILFNTFSTGVPSTRNDWPSVASQLTLLIPQSALGTGSGGVGTKFLADDQTYKTVSSGGITSLAPTNAFVPSVIGAAGFVPTAFIHSNAFNAQSVGGAFTFGGFQGTNWSAATVGLGAGSATAAIGDFNTNGTLDFVLPANLSASFKVYTNVSINGYAGQFSLAFTGTAAGSILGVCTADVNGDLRPDIIVVSGSAVEVFTNNGAAAQFVKEGSSYTVSGGVQAYSADFNGDGSADFIVSSSSGAATEWTNNLGTGVFVQDTASTFPAYAHATLPGAIAHFMGTTNWDIVLNNGTPVGVLLMTNNGSGVFTISTTNKDFLINGSMNTNDFNGDGMVDVVVDQSASGKTYVVTNNGVGGFGDYSSNNVPGASGSTLPVSTGDFNMDGLPDIVQSGGSGTGGYVILTNAGPGLGFGTFTTNLIQVNPMEVWVGDFNQDGRADIGWYGFGSGSAQDSVNITYNLPVLYGILQGDGTNIVNGSITVTYSSSAVTPAGAWQPNLATFGNLNISSNYLPYSATAALFTLGTVMTANTTATVTFNTAGKSETVYNTSASTIGSLAITLSTSATPGMINRYATHGICSVVTVTGTVSIGAAVTAITADSSVAWQALTSSTWARIQ